MLKVSSLPMFIVYISIHYQNSLGRISYTSDLWSNGVLSGFMAATAHFCVRDPDTHLIALRSELAAFRHVPGSHDGPSLGSHFVRIVKELEVLHKVGAILGAYRRMLTEFPDRNSHARQRRELQHDDGIRRR